MLIYYSIITIPGTGTKKAKDVGKTSLLSVQVYQIRIKMNVKTTHFNLSKYEKRRETKSSIIYIYICKREEEKHNSYILVK